MNKVEMKAVELNFDMELVKKELKRIASIKCRLKKQRGKASYEKDMSEAVEYENLIKEVRSLIVGDSNKSVTQYTQEDVSKLNYDETIRAIKSIQSKKSNSKWLTEIEGDNDEYRKACEIEQMLRVHKELLQPTLHRVDTKVLESIIENANNMAKEDIIEAIKNML